MLNTLKSILPDGIEIKDIKELSNRYKLRISYRGMEASTELYKLCSPGEQVAVCQKAIDTAMSTMYMNIGDLKKAGEWLRGEYWKRMLCETDEDEHDIITISSLIERLEKIKSKYGDLPIWKVAECSDIAEPYEPMTKFPEMNCVIGEGMFLDEQATIMSEGTIEPYEKVVLIKLNL